MADKRRKYVKHRCPLCGAKFSTMSALNKHMKRYEKGWRR